MPPFYTFGSGLSAICGADIYVFCTQIEQDSERWNALDLNQWRFYLLTKSEMEQLNQKSLSLGVLARMCPEMTADEFQARAMAMVDATARVLSLGTGGE